jgi:peptide/nickel transport system permease protein
MFRYAAQRVLGMLPTLLLLVFAVVLFSKVADTDVIDTLMAGQATDKVSRQEFEARLGLDKSLPEAYVDYVAGVPRGDLGTSLLSGRSVRTMVFERLNITLELAILALAIGWTVGAAVGIVSAMTQDGPVDYLLRGIAILGLTIPNFALATAVVILPAIYFNWSPPLIYTKLSDNPVAHVKQFIFPALVLGFGLMGGSMRIMRTQMLEVLRQDYIRTARVKGLGETRVVLRHALKNAMIPVISVFGLQVAAVMSGAVIIETIFALPGLGRLLIEAVSQKDWPVVQGVTVVVGCWVMLVNLLVDLSYGLFDPRIKVGGGR